MTPVSFAGLRSWPEILGFASTLSLSLSLSHLPILFGNRTRDVSWQWTRSRRGTMRVCARCEYTGTTGRRWSPLDTIGKRSELVEQDNRTRQRQTRGQNGGGGGGKREIRTEVSHATDLDGAIEDELTLRDARWFGSIAKQRTRLRTSDRRCGGEKRSAAVPRAARLRVLLATRHAAHETPRKCQGNATERRAASAFNRRVDRANLLFAPACFLSRERLLVPRGGLVGTCSTWSESFDEPKRTSSPLSLSLSLES